jgi:hypothetical protein
LRKLRPARLLDRILMPYSGCAHRCFQTSPLNFLGSRHQGRKPGFAGSNFAFGVMNLIGALQQRC